MNSKLLVGSAFASLCAVVVACTITTERPADSSPPPSPPPPVPVAPAPAPTPAATPTPTATGVADAGEPVAVADAGTTDAGSADAAPIDGGGAATVATPPIKKAAKRPVKPASDAGAATGDGGT